MEWPLSQLCHYLIAGFLTPPQPSSLPPPLPYPPHCPGCLRYTLGSARMLSRWPGVCSHRVHWFEVIWTQWRWWFFFATVPLQLVQDSKPVYMLRVQWPGNMFYMSRTELDRDVFICHGLACVFYGLHAFCECVRKRSEVSLWQRWVLFVFVCCPCPESFLLQSDHHAVNGIIFIPGAERQHFPFLHCIICSTSFDANKQGSNQHRWFYSHLHTL